MIIINAENLILGRMATFVVKKALLGEKIDIINCEKAVMTGNKKEILAKFRHKRTIGRPTKGPFIQRRADMIVRRSLRGMLPYKQEKGRKAFERIMCHVGVPEEFKDKETEKVENADADKLPNLKFIKIEQICRFMRSK